MRDMGWFNRMRGFANSGSTEKIYLAWLGSSRGAKFAKIRQVVMHIIPRTHKPPLPVSG